MSRVRQKNTAPELSVRFLLKARGIKFSTNAADLPGSPDICDRVGKRAVLINGCFWHRHAGCRAASTPKSNESFWAEKFLANMRRDRKNMRALRRLGYRVLVVWECQLRSSRRLRRLRSRLAVLFPNIPIPARIDSDRAVNEARTGHIDRTSRAVSEVRVTAKPERFSISKDGAQLRRTIQRFDGRKHTTVFEGFPRPKKGLHQDRVLATLADVAFLRQDEWPTIDPDAPVVRSVDLFSGCGLMTLGVWEACRAIGLRLEPVQAVDVNSVALRTYKLNFPDATTICQDIDSILDGDLGAALTDAEKHSFGNLGTVDLLIGGPPCQGNSDLNNYTRRSDPKNRLYERMARFCEIVRPTHVIVENVSAVLHDRGGAVRNTADVIRALGYNVNHGVLDSGALGAPQRRKRHVLVASKERLIDFQDLRSRYSRPPLTVGQAIADLRNRVDDSVFDGAGHPTDKSLRRIDHLFDKNIYDLPDRYRPVCHREKEHSYRSVYGRMHWDRPAQTITSGFTCMGQGRYVHPKDRRTITPHEAARLQSIPDFFHFDLGTRRTALAEMIGNAVPSKLTYVVALELLR